MMPSMTISLAVLGSSGGEAWAVGDVLARSNVSIDSGAIDRINRPLEILPKQALDAPHCNFVQIAGVQASTPP
jgi:hypothetical protein